jgi:hypothetical protein
LTFGSFYQLLPDVISLAFIIVEVRIQIIGEKENFQYGKHNKKLYQYDNPKASAHGHSTETFAVKFNRFLYKQWDFHIARQ